LLHRASFMIAVCVCVLRPSDFKVNVLLRLFPDHACVLSRELKTVNCKFRARLYTVNVLLNSRCVAYKVDVPVYFECSHLH